MTTTLLTKKELQLIKSFDYGEESKPYAILQTIDRFIEEGVSQGRFTQEQAEHDLQIALWVAYACSNCDEYEYYYRSVQWLKRVEDLAEGCGTWFYRYSVALMYIGRPEEALLVSEKGVLEEPAYPWGWLQLAALRSHFGNKVGALEANEKGQALVPGDYEFTRQQDEIRQGKTIEEMQNHYIFEEADLELKTGGLEEEAISKQQAIAGIVCDQENLVLVKETLGVENWKPDHPYCTFTFSHQEQWVEGTFLMNEAAVSKCNIEWITKVAVSFASLNATALATLQEGRGDTTPYKLAALTIARDHCLSLHYDFGQEDEHLTVQFGPDLEIDPKNQQLYTPEVYGKEELDAVEAHVEAYFGKFHQVLHEIVSPDIHVDIYLIEPTVERDYYTLVTGGMGAHRMNVPEGAEGWARAEVLICLPSDWDIGSQEERDYWPIRLLKMLARMPIEQDSWLGSSHTVSYSDAFEGTKFTGVILLGMQDGEQGAAVCSLPDGEAINFYQVFPLYEEEMNFKLENGIDAFYEVMTDIDPVLDIGRPNMQEGFQGSLKKQFYLSSDEVKPLLTDWEEPVGCIATDRILVDGCKVGYMYREEPDSEEYPDSGWRFTAGDESDDYMDDPANSGIYALNTICNYDPEIIPLLKASFGTAFQRDENGVFQREDYVPREEEGLADMVKLYKKEGDSLLYAEFWKNDEGNVMIHTGLAGTTGESETQTYDDFQDFVKEFITQYQEKGYAPWPEEQETWIVAQFPMKKYNMEKNNPAKKDIALRNQAESLLNESLGWTGLGHVDGWEMGRSFDNPNSFVLNIYCVVVHRELGVNNIRETLEKNLDCSRLKIAAMSAEKEEYTLVYTANKMDQTFSL